LYESTGARLRELSDGRGLVRVDSADRVLRTRVFAACPQSQQDSRPSVLLVVL